MDIGCRVGMVTILPYIECLFFYLQEQISLVLEPQF